MDPGSDDDPGDDDDKKGEESDASEESDDPGDDDDKKGEESDASEAMVDQMCRDVEDQKGGASEEDDGASEVPKGKETYSISSSDDDEPKGKFADVPMTSPGTKHSQPKPTFLEGILKETAGYIPNSEEHKKTLNAARAEKRLKAAASKATAVQAATSSASASEAPTKRRKTPTKRRKKAASGEFKLLRKHEKTRTNEAFWTVIEKVGKTWKQRISATPRQFGSESNAKKACESFLEMLEQGNTLEKVKEAKARCTN